MLSGITYSDSHNVRSRHNEGDPDHHHQQGVSQVADPSRVAVAPPTHFCVSFGVSVAAASRRKNGCTSSNTG